MKKGVVYGIIFLAALFTLFPLASSASVDSEINQITHYAEQYETGNINYVQLLVYTSSSREKLNEMLGVLGKENGGILKQSQIESVLGEPDEKTKWMWAEGLNHDVKIEEYVPVWRKIIFDGKKIQIRLNAHPSVLAFTDGNSGEVQEKIYGPEDVVYRLNFEINFKKPEEQTDILGKINDVKTFAENYKADSSDANAEALAKASVDAEKMFWNYFDQNSGNCDELMSSIFGSENKREEQNLYLQEIDFYEGENFQAIAKLEMCDECEWNWINTEIRIEGRGPKFKSPPDFGTNEYSKELYKGMSDEDLQTETYNLIEKIKSDLSVNDISSAQNSVGELRVLTNAWNEKANDVWKQVDEEYQARNSLMTEEQRRQLNENYGWIKLEQEKRQRQKELQLINYQNRKQFYVNLFSGYDKSEFYYTQTQYEKRLVEDFKTIGQETCDNNLDDNDDGQTDCADSQCGGKICGKTTFEISDGNVTSPKEINLYCIANTCQAREEIVEEQMVVCGNHVCEENESVGNCAEDCSLCRIYDAVNCSGEVIFSGEDENGCPLQPVCVEDNSCVSDDDCSFLCGTGACVEGVCELKELAECKEAECESGQEKVVNCNSGEKIVSSFCQEGIWNNLENVVCPTEEIVGEAEIVAEGEVFEEVVVGEAVGNECVMAGDCGGENDVCSNGQCVRIPEAIKVAEETSGQNNIENEENFDEGVSPSGESENNEVNEPSSESSQESSSGSESNSPSESAPETESPSESAPEPSVTGGIIFNFLRNAVSKISLRITGYAEENVEVVSESPDSSGSGSDATGGENPSGESPGEFGQQPGNEVITDGENPEGEGSNGGENIQNPPQENFNENNYDDQNNNQNENNEQNNWEEQQKDRCADDCERTCYDSKVRPCVEKCIFESCGQELDCSVDEESKKCEENCRQENDLDSCVDDCSPKCIAGGNWWEEFGGQKPEEQKMEQSVFNAGGGCRTSQGKTESFMWFGGWGEPFENVEPLKQKYYNGGQAEWCKYDYENLLKQRQEFESGFNQEFISWFFGDYLANSAGDWEQHVSGIFELYWKNVDNIRETASRMDCLGIEEFPSTNLISLSYETEYGSIEYWEEMKTVRMPEMEKEVTLISPYMKVWIFPSKEFMKYEFESSMASGEFPGNPEEKAERKNQDGPTEEEKAQIKQDEKFMNYIKEISGKYGGQFDLSVQIKDFETGEVVYNIYAQVNENDIIKMQPMIPEDVPSEDARIEIDFKEVYDLIYSIEKEMNGARTESPPWEKRNQDGGIKQFTDGIKVSMKVRGMIENANVYPPEAEKDARDLVKTFMKMMMQGEDKNQNTDGENEKNLEDEAWNTMEEEGK